MWLILLQCWGLIIQAGIALQLNLVEGLTRLLALFRFYLKTSSSSSYQAQALDRLVNGHEEGRLHLRSPAGEPQSIPPNTWHIEAFLVEVELIRHAAFALP